MFKIGKLLNSIDELLEKNSEYEIVKKREYINKKLNMVSYINISSSFDIEVSSFKYNNEKCSCMYVWQFGINGDVVIGRTWDEYIECMNKVIKFFNLNENTRLPIYVHNLQYEFQFIRNYFEWHSLFAREKRKPMKALTTSGLEFRCSYVLSGCSLEKTCENLVKYKCSKKVGDLDYNKIRTPETPLTDTELDYCIYDVIGVMCYIQEEIEIYGNVVKIPLTKTSKARLYCRERCFSKENKDGYNKLMNVLTINDVNEYNMLKRAFQGGFTHANYRNVNKVHLNVESKDFTSSYPTVMVSEKYPMSKGKLTEINTIEEITILSNIYCFIFYIEFNDIKPIVDFEHYISVSKCFNVKNPKVDNGRLISADTIQTTITDIDLEIIKKCYSWSSYKIGVCYKYVKSYLPTPFIKCLLDFYEDKTTLKDVAGKEVEYQLKKQLANCLFGMTCTDVFNDEITYDGNWDVKFVNEEEEIKKYNGSRSRFLFYPWGVFITAYARKNLWDGILELKNDYIYSDTDSVKFMNYENHKEYFENYNKNIIDKLSTACEIHKIPVDKICPSTIKGVIKPLGIWDDDGSYTRFKTLGAKRYLVEYLDDDNTKHLKCTIAGVNKKNTSKFLEKQKDGFETFNNLMTVPKKYSGRLIVTYLDEPIDGIIKDMYGKQYEFHELSGIHMEQSDYNLTMTDIYLSLLLENVEGEL